MKMGAYKIYNIKVHGPMWDHLKVMEFIWDRLDPTWTEIERHMCCDSMGSGRLFDIIHHLQVAQWIEPTGDMNNDRYSLTPRGLQMLGERLKR